MQDIALNNPVMTGLESRAGKRRLWTSPAPEPDGQPATKKKAGSNIYRLIMPVGVAAAVLSAIIYLVVGYVGAEIAGAGHSADTGKRSVIIGLDVVIAPANMIRYPTQRRLAEADQLDLYLHWPELDGYSEKLKTDFNALEDNADILFVTLAPRFSSYDMTGRIKPIYQKYFTGPPVEIGNGLVKYSLDEKAGFIDEYLVVQKNSPYPFSARCVRGVTNGPAPYCIRDIHIGKNLSLTYRFHKKLIGEWLALDESIRAKFKTMIR